ncbi:DUF3318 domain-containing protein [Crocosphaera watsonii WH 8501]|uniref:DUF3318 domain-containing protein n=6 Tax=Crocosphaera watsonii TaxID=263511 RepID=Q4BXH5_CROWT|nr:MULTISPECIES: DUF3318 domain-containing protein [Crocosphaera]EAM48611.1 hypothetical protein CwatDRAFT_1882 [Crocosphaera watsonii WH 8501]EHJ10833.1 hypothetical protein CWATWH0003_4401 [Crocosphaera watsonii WH 0003]MCH2244554.1 DUF3318 domain-containing protein [Crocosphaera sp.]NQZ64183.1 DUF3318 domain-containing protein [Crocosphaera sp.]CCQ51082.1 FIG00558785: hypothetical protein [Crocosphaera watsonii WH 8502]
MSIDAEISRLLDMMPASGRMLTKIISQPQQSKVIDAPFAPPWNRESRPIYINFDLWRRLPRGQRDLLILRATSSLINIRWFKPDINQLIVLAGTIGLMVETGQGDAVGILIAAGLTAISIRQIWRDNRNIQRELDTDEAAIKVSLRRGYTEVEAAQNLLQGIENAAKIEGRSILNFTELIRSQHLKSLANLSSIDVPEKIDF